MDMRENIPALDEYPKIGYDCRETALLTPTLATASQFAQFAQL